MASQTIQVFGSRVKETPWGLPQMLCALDALLAPPKQLVIAGSLARKDTETMVKAFHAMYQPNTLLLLADEQGNSPFLEKKVPVLESLRPIEGKATAYVCENFACKLPTTDMDEMIELLSSSRR